MGRASQALKMVLETYEISQNRLAVAMGVSRANVGRWFHGLDPSAENIAEITKALNQINPVAAHTFVQRYLGELIDPKLSELPKAEPSKADMPKADQD